MEYAEITIVFLFFLFSGLAIKNKNSIYYFLNIINEAMNINIMSKSNVLKNEELKKSNEEIQILPPKKYEDKYWDQIHEMDTSYVFTEEEQLVEEKQYNLEKEAFEKTQLELENKIHSLETVLRNMNEDNTIYEEDEEDERNEYKEECLHEIQELEKSLENFQKNNNEELLKEKARNHVIKTRLEKLKKCFIIEKTPLGNVAMYYNTNRDTFEYFSDNTIPYRFLEVVGRKYVISFQCRPLYIIMEQELKKYEEKMKEERQKQEQKKLLQEEQNSQSTIIPKKNVFAKFKSYNKEAGSGRVNKAPPPKNSIPHSNISNKQREKIILKENANRYTYEGRFSNFNPLQKIQRKQVDKKYALNYAEFKKKLLTTNK